MSTALSETFDLTLEQHRLIAEMRQVPVPQGARGLWFKSKVLQLLADFFFARTGEGELFCDRQKRLSRERVNRAISVLDQRLADPPSLHELGRIVGCSPFHLSRTFSKEMQLTIPQYIRKLRMERAAELLRSGKFNVTEAALEVGYSSLSHFSQAFCQTIGCCPALYPLGLKSKSQP
jgi:AraC-like DNA-binding protein